VYPNPTEGYLQCKVGKWSRNYRSNGYKWTFATISQCPASTYHINIGPMAVGIYLICVNMDGGNYICKHIKN